MKILIERAVPIKKGTKEPRNQGTKQRKKIKYRVPISLALVNEISHKLSVYHSIISNLPPTNLPLLPALLPFTLPPLPVLLLCKGLGHGSALAVTKVGIRPNQTQAPCGQL